MRLPVLTLLATLFTAAAGVAAAGGSATGRDVLVADGLRQITVTAGADGALTPARLAEAGRLEGVREIVPDYVADLRGPSYLLTSHTLTPAEAPPVTGGSLPARLGPRDVVLPERVGGTDLRRYVGRDVAFRDAPALRVVAVYDPRWQP
ncbi:hypothetical protein, partial [Streptomyces sp. SID11385]|uniref:hypothetical protein n=1 Tax=Streptomyces sp. SID11385 TaxID=2706031 RepID=UPI0013C7ACB1